MECICSIGWGDYLFGRWCGGAVECLMKSACHQSLTAMLYVEDADAQLAIAHLPPTHQSFKLSAYIQVYICQGDYSYTSIKPTLSGFSVRSF